MLIEDLYYKVFLIRACEDAIKAYYHEDGMKTPMHMSAGGESIAAGVCAALSPTDQIFGTYRTHAIYLAKTNDPESFFGELYGKASGLARGKAGSMHLSSPDHGYMLSSAIVASTIPVAVGNAFANKICKNGKMTVVFFGDGATNEGCFWESMNIACLWKIPIIFLCEDNELAVHTHKSLREGYDDLMDIVSKFDCYTFSSESTDAVEIHELAKKSIDLARDKPVFLRLKYYRYLEHVGVNYDFNAGYRSKGGFDEWFKRDPVFILRSRLPQEIVERIESDVNRIVGESIAKAKLNNLVPISELLDNVFSE